MLADSEISGLSRFMIVDMCRTLSEKGFDRTCLGGSENEGLDHFKRLLRPVHSLSVSSLRPSSENTFQFRPKLPNKEPSQKISYG